MKDNLLRAALSGRVARKEAAFPWKATTAAAGLGAKTLGALIFVAAPALFGFTGGIIGSKITSPDTDDLDRMQDDAIAADLRDRTERLKTLPARKAPKNLGREGIWRP